MLTDLSVFLHPGSGSGLCSSCGLLVSFPVLELCGHPDTVLSEATVCFFFLMGLGQRLALGALDTLSCVSQ